MSYQQLSQLFHRLSQLQHAQAMLSWDRETLMPAKGAQARAQCLAELEVMSTELLQQAQIPGWLTAAQAEDLDPWRTANLRLMCTHYQRQALIPTPLVQQLSLAQSEAIQAWQQARANNDWLAFAPFLQKQVELLRQQAQLWFEGLGQQQGYANAYDALLDLYNPGLRMQRVEQIFDRLKAELPELISQVRQQQEGWQPLIPQSAAVAVDKQQQLARTLMKRLGFDFAAGRLDTSVHPFSGGVSQDSRITTRYDEHNVLEGLMGVVHETGHSRYETGLPKVWAYQPVGSSLGMSIHESQSLFFEMQMGRSLEFLRAISPLLVEHVGAQAAFSPDQLYANYTRVEPGLIRVNADELTYPLHVILRYELESKLILGQIQVADLPEFWHQSMQAYLGLCTLGNDKDGVLQDIHWPSGAFGYFPSYTLGAMIAAQLAYAMRQDLPDYPQLVAKLRLEPIFGWLSERIWLQASFYDTQELVVQATGEVLNPDYFLAHLRKRYLA